jgi:hypothetical protein
MTQEDSAEDPGTRFARISGEIQRARRQLAALRHEGGRHFIDDAAVHPDVPAVLEDIVARGTEIEQLHALTTDATAVNPAFTEDPAAAERLKQLEARIQTLSQLCEDPHKTERHFIDG